MALTKGGVDVPYKQGGRLQTEKVDCIDWPAIMFWPSLINETLNGVRCSERLADIVKLILGTGDIKQLNNQLYYRLPGGEDAFDWHTDLMFRRDVESTVVEDYVQTVIVVDEWIPNNGAMLFNDDVSLCPSKTALRNEPTELGHSSILASSGDVVTWKVTKPHASFKNNSYISRMTYMNGFCRARSAPDSWPYYINDGEIQHTIDKDTIPYD